MGAGHEASEAMTDRRTYRLGDLQLRIMRVLWESAPGSVAEVLRGLDGSLAYTTVATMLRKMGILRAKEMPEVEVIGVEVPDPIGPHGAKGVGEIGLVPTAGAVANAFAQYDGTRYYKLPIKNRVKGNL